MAKKEDKEAKKEAKKEDKEANKDAKKEAKNGAKGAYTSFVKKAANQSKKMGKN